MPMSDNAVRLHDELAEEWENKYAQASFQRRAGYFLDYLQGINIVGQTWLDGGCGTGYLARALARLQRKGG